MLPYYAIFTFLAFLSLAESQSVKRKQRSLLLSGGWLLLTLFAGLRYNNADWNSYFDFYKNIAKRIIGLVSVLIFLCSKISCIQIFVLPLTEIVNV